MKFPMQPFNVNRDKKVKYGIAIPGFSAIKSKLDDPLSLLLLPMIFMSTIVLKLFCPDYCDKIEIGKSIEYHWFYWG